MSEGRLFYVVGAAAAGKDSLIHYARTRAGEHHGLVFAHCYATHPVSAAGGNLVVLSHSEFLLRKRHGLFVLDWESHGSRYGIGTEINYWLAMALSVVVNGSRACLDLALKRYPDMTVIWISAVPELIDARPGRRGRDAHREDVGRIVRGPTVSAHPGRPVVHVNNVGSDESAGENLLAVLRHHRQ